MVSSASLIEVIADKLRQYGAKHIVVDPVMGATSGAKLLKESNGMKYASFTEKDFIEYLNDWIFPDEPSVLVKEFDCFFEELPKEYGKVPKYNF